MTKCSFQKHVTLYQSHVDVLNTIMEKNPEVNNYSEAIRFLCMSYDPETNQTRDKNQAKINAMGKEISIIAEMVSEFADLHLKETGILIGKKSALYEEAKERVEEQIKSNQTKKYYAKHRTPIEKNVVPKNESFDPTSFLKR